LAATARPSPSVIGTAIERSPSSSFWSTTAQPLRLTLLRTAVRACGVSTVRGVSRSGFAEATQARSFGGAGRRAERAHH
jgi:hypothetical protein